MSQLGKLLVLFLVGLLAGCQPGCRVSEFGISSQPPTPSKSRETPVS